MHNVVATITLASGHVITTLITHSNLAAAAYHVGQVYPGHGAYHLVAVKASFRGRPAC